MLKKIITISLISTIMYGEYRSTTFKRAEERDVKKEYKKIEKKKTTEYKREYKKEVRKTENKNDRIYFRGTVRIIDRWYDYSEIYITNREDKEIRARISKNEPWKVNDRIIADCKDLVSGFYRNCRIKRRY